jgi:hypothetical protein
LTAAAPGAGSGPAVSPRAGRGFSLLRPARRRGKLVLPAPPHDPATGPTDLAHSGVAGPPTVAYPGPRATRPEAVRSGRRGTAPCSPLGAVRLPGTLRPRPRSATMPSRPDGRGIGRRTAPLGVPRAVCVPAALYDRLAAWLRDERGLTVQTEDDQGRRSAGGRYWHDGRQVYVRPAAPAQMLCVLVHEAAHHLARGHADGDHGYAANEAIVQSIAYAVCDRFGLDAGGFSAHYAAGWLRRDPDGFKKGMGFVRAAAAALIGAAEAEPAAADADALAA